MPGRIGTTSVMALRQSLLLPNDCKLRPSELRAELENSFSNNDFVDTLDDGKMNVRGWVDVNGCVYFLWVTTWCWGCSEVMQ